MGLVLKYVQRTKSGSLHYRRRVPDRLKAVIGKREIKRFLGNSEREALAEYPAVHRNVEKLFAQAETQSAASQVCLTALQEYEQLERRLRQLGVDIYDDTYDDNGFLVEEPHRSSIADGIVYSYPQDPQTGDAVGMTREDLALVRALHAGLPPRPAPTLEDAKRLYVKLKIGADEDGDAKKKVQRVERVIGHAIDALGRNRMITDIRRVDARKVVEYLEHEIGAMPATGKRYLNDLKAIINLAIKEYELAIPSPFDGLTIELKGSRKEDRRPFTEKELRLIRGRISEFGNAELQNIWHLLEYSGCRLFEIVGLMKSEVVLEEEGISYIRIEPNACRSLKNASSIRDIPLSEEALMTTKKALKESPEDSPFVFPHYASEVNKDAASAALMKHVRAVTTDPKVSVHSLRHNLADKLRIAGVPEDIMKMVLGHAGKGITERYGGAETRLRIISEALRGAAASESDYPI